MMHKRLSIRTVATYECGSCGKEWDEEGEDALSHAYPDDFIGDEAECEHCGEELEVEGDDDDEGT